MSDDANYDYSIESSIGSNLAKWLHIAELKGLLLAMPEGPQKARAAELIGLLHTGFSFSDERLWEMRARRDRKKRGRK